MKRNQKVLTERVQKEKFQRNQFQVLTPKNEKQSELMEALKYSTIVVAQGSAGVGKTMLACWHAARKLHFKDVDKVVLIRAYQPLAGRTIGMLPGDADQKLIPFYQQMIDYFEDSLGKATTEIHIKNKTIEICSLETIRGRSWSKAIIIVDEAQSLFVPEIQALTTRIGDDCQMIFCGDNTGNQTDVKNGMDGLTFLNKLVAKYKIPDVEFVTFNRNHICRSNIVRDFVISYEEEMLAEEFGKPTIVSKSEVDKQFKKGR